MGKPLDVAALEAEHALLARRLDTAGGAGDAVDLWRRMGVEQAAVVPDMSAAEVRALRRHQEVTR